MRYLLTILTVLGLSATLAAATFSVKIKVEDPTGDGVKDDLIIVQDLDHRENELLRVLSDKNGCVPPLELPSGLYRIIATAPYGLWQTNVREFLVGRRPINVVVRVQPIGTHGHGDIVNIGTSRANLQVIAQDGRPADGARILARDRTASIHTERWYKADRQGKVTIELVDKPTVVVIIYDDFLQITELSDGDLNPIIHLTGY